MLGPLTSVIDAILEQDRTAPRKQRHTARRIWERLVSEHRAEIAEPTVRRHVDTRNRELWGPSEVMVPQVHEPGLEAAAALLVMVGYVAVALGRAPWRSAGGTPDVGALSSEWLKLPSVRSLWVILIVAAACVPLAALLAWYHPATARARRPAVAPAQRTDGDQGGPGGLGAGQDARMSSGPVRGHVTRRSRPRAREQFSVLPARRARAPRCAQAPRPSPRSRAA